MTASLQPGDTLGIIGGGQLGRMIAMAAARLGLKTIVLDPQKDAPAFQCANEALVAGYDDVEALNALAAKSDVITYEFENVDVDAIRALEGAHCFPDAVALETSQDRLVEKRFFASLDIPTAPFFDVTSRGDLLEALEKSGGKGILKTRRFGYDGKGQIRVSLDNAANHDEAVSMLEKTPCILEGFVDFEREISVVAGCNADGGFVPYDPAENVHRDGILRTSTIPANVSASVAEAAVSATRKAANALKYRGVIAIEFFVLPNGGLIANEFAPRVHNSGHWTEAACSISQFEQHVRAVAGMPLGNPSRHSDCVMENIIGDDMDKVPAILADGSPFLHLYGKGETRPGRKMGHLTTISPMQ